MDEKWMIMYRLIDDVYEPIQFGSDLVPMQNIDKVIHVPEEIARQAFKFEYDGEALTRKDGKYVMSLEQLREKELQDEKELHGGMPSHVLEGITISETKINL